MGAGSSSTSFSSDLPHFANADGARLFVKRWSPQGEPKAVMFVCHGVGEHIERYNQLACILSEKGFLVVGNDCVGHGKSEGRRVDCEDFHVYVRDALQHVHSVKDELPNIPFFLFGHSMGGAVAILAALESPGLFSGVLLSAPMIIANPEEATRAKLLLARAAGAVFPQLHVGRLNPNFLSRDPEQVRAYIEDPLVYHGGLKARWAVCSLKAMDEVQQRMGEMTLPYLLMHGSDDRAVLLQGSEMFHAKSQSEDKTLKVYTGYYHEILNESKEYSDIVINDIVSWLEARLG